MKDSSAIRISSGDISDMEIVKLLAENIFSKFADRNQRRLKTDPFFKKCEFRKIGVGYRMNWKGDEEIVEFRIFLKGTGRPHVTGMLVHFPTFRKDPAEYAAHVAVQLNTCAMEYEKFMQKAKKGPTLVALDGNVLQ